MPGSPVTERTPWAVGDPMVVFGPDWGRYPSTLQHLFQQVSTRTPVVWVNAVAHRSPTLTLADFQRAVQKVSAIMRSRTGPAAAETGEARPQLIVEPKVLPWHQFGPVYAFNTWSLVRTIRGALRTLGTTRPPVLVTGSPTTAGVVGRLDEALSVYFCMDDFLNFPGVSASMIAPLEAELRCRVDVLVATARSLTISKRPASGLAYQLPQGVNYDHFAAPTVEPAAFQAIPRPRIGFSGTIGGQCDYPLLRRLADAFPQASIVLVGPVTEGAAVVDTIRAKNVHFLGVQSYADLPAYVQAFDVGIIPYVLNEWTMAVDSLKLLEYLAAGLPVVSTTFPEVEKYANIVAMVPDADAFIAAVGSALVVPAAVSRERGRAFARQHTWARRADAFLEIVTTNVAGKAA